MTHTPIHHLAVGILAIAVAGVIWLALSTTTVPASARTFNFNSGGSMVQQSLPPQWACELSRALGERTLPCRNSVVRQATGEPPARPSLRGSAKAIAAPAAASTPSAAGRDKRSE